MPLLTPIITLPSLNDLFASTSNLGGTVFTAFDPFFGFALAFIVGIGAIVLILSTLAFVFFGHKK